MRIIAWACAAFTVFVAVDFLGGSWIEVRGEQGPLRQEPRKVEGCLTGTLYPRL